MATILAFLLGIIMHILFGVETNFNNGYLFDNAYKELHAKIDLSYFNDNYKRTNTAKSLLYALDSKKLNSDIIWLNGDVVFDSKILKSIFELEESSMLVNTNSVSDEEVKYNINNDGTINEVSKNIQDGLGEAVGINKILRSDLKEFKYQLEQCSNNDYFEYGIELLINQNIKIYPIDISKYFCCEIDTQDDLDFVNKYLKK